MRGPCRSRPREGLERGATKRGAVVAGRRRRRRQRVCDGVLAARGAHPHAAVHRGAVRRRGACRRRVHDQQVARAPRRLHRRARAVRAQLGLRERRGARAPSCSIAATVRCEPRSTPCRRRPAVCCDIGSTCGNGKSATSSALGRPEAGCWGHGKPPGRSGCARDLRAARSHGAPGGQVLAVSSNRYTASQPWSDHRGTRVQRGAVAVNVPSLFGRRPGRRLGHREAHVDPARTSARGFSSAGSARVGGAAGMGERAVGRGTSPARRPRRTPSSSCWDRRAAGRGWRAARAPRRARASARRRT